MHPTHSLALLLLLGLCFLPGCRAESPDHPVRTATDAGQDDGERDAVLSVLRSLRTDAMLDAFDRLSLHRYTRYTRTEQFDAAYHRIASTERTTRLDLRDGAAAQTVLQADSAGAFDFGYLRRFTATDADARTPSDLPQYVLPEDPPYLAPRNRDAFSYRFLPDTVLWNLPVQVVDVRARPGSGDDQTIRHARFFLDRSSGALIALSLERREKTLFFREESRFYIQIRPALEGGWVPYHTRFLVRLRVPFRAPQQFRTVSTYYAFGPPG